MIYLIGQLFVWLLLTAIAAAVAGWLYAAQRGEGARLAQRRERERLIRDLGRLAGGASSNADDLEADRARNEAADALSRVRESRIAELERAVETARARNDELTSEAAELRRRLDSDESNAEELTRLRALSATLEAERAREIEAVAEPVVEQDDTLQLMTWRLRYFEQRSRYLESQPRPVAALPPPPVVAPEPLPVSPLPEWRAREAAARAHYLESELRALSAAPAEEPAPEAEPEPFAANADVDVLLRWRMLYLERRVAHLQAQAALEPASVEPEPPPAPVQDSGPDPDMWKWRARYLEARVRHLEQRPPVVIAAPQPVAAPVEGAVDEPPPARPAPRRGAKPPVLTSARNGAPDDFTLIESISQLQQTTLYALGIYHYDQIAAWTPEHVTWIDNYLRLQGRIDQEEWREQAAELAEHGPAAARRVLEDEDA